MVKIYQVGGSVRDMFLGVKSKDIDYAVEASSWEEMREYILSKGKIYLETPKYFTIRAHIDKLGDADFVLCRKDGDYSDGRRPDSVKIGTLEDDLARRDFTMNAIAINMDNGLVIDPYNGRADIARKVIKCVGEPWDRFSEDALRMLRALRFSITKNMTIYPTIVLAFQNDKLLEMLENNISIDRKIDELRKMLKFNTWETLLELIRYPGLFNVLFKRSDSRLWLEPTLKE